MFYFIKYKYILKIYLKHLRIKIYLNKIILLLNSLKILCFKNLIANYIQNLKDLQTLKKYITDISLLKRNKL